MKAGITADVRRAIDENAEGGALLTEEDSETLTLDALIGSKIEEGVRHVIAGAPLTMIDSGKTITGSVTMRAASGSGYLILPDDFMRLLLLKLGSWERPVTTAIGAGDPRYAMQFSRHAGIRGTRQKPVAALTRRSTGLALEMFPFSSGDGIEQGFYYPYPKMDADGGINIPEALYEAAVYRTAALTLKTYGEAEKAALLERECASLLQT